MFPSSGFTDAPAAQGFDIGYTPLDLSVVHLICRPCPSFEGEPDYIVSTRGRRQRCEQLHQVRKGMGGVACERGIEWDPFVLKFRCLWPDEGSGNPSIDPLFDRYYEFLGDPESLFEDNLIFSFVEEDVRGRERCSDTFCCRIGSEPFTGLLRTGSGGTRLGGGGVSSGGFGWGFFGGSGGSFVGGFGGGVITKVEEPDPHPPEGEVPIPEPATWLTLFSSLCLCFAAHCMSVRKKNYCSSSEKR